MASSNLATLQRTVNRYASKVGFAPIPVDGGMGVLTAQAVNKAVTFVAGGGGFFDFGLSDNTKASASQLLKGIAAAVSVSVAQLQTFIMQQNVLINQTLAQGASELGLPAAALATPVATSSGGSSGVAVTFDPTTLNAKLPQPPGAGGSFLSKFGKPLGLTDTQTVLFVAMMGGVGFLAYKKMRGAR